MTVHLLLSKHNRLLQYIDQWFRSIQAKCGDQMQCGRGCAQCCYGLFDVSLPDAFRVAEAFRLLPAEIRSMVADRASAIQERICQEGTELRAPFFLNEISLDRIDQIVEQIPNIRCPLLDESDCCLTYRHRPLACRLEGVPMVDSHDGLFGDWCELNFKGGVSAELSEYLGLDYYEIQATEQEVTGHLAHHLLGSRQEEVTIFIPSIIAGFDIFWKFQ